MSEPALKCEKNAIFKQNYTLELFIALKIASSCCFGLRGNLHFPDFLQKSFITSTHGPLVHQILKWCTQSKNKNILSSWTVELTEWDDKVPYLILLEVSIDFL